MEDLNFINNNPGAVRYGNFINYYQFHPPENRISLLPKDIWNTHSIQKKSCTLLDVGCNAGDLTTALYNFFTSVIKMPECNILGIDIDPTLIKRACEKNSIENCSFICCDIMNENSQENILMNYLNPENSTRFDMVFCFSITMWIHLNHGDNGLKTFLKKVSDLADILVIEPQPWKCYKSAVKRLRSTNSECTKFKELKIRQNIECEIEAFILEHCGLEKITESVRTEWDRKLLFFRRK